MKMHRKQINIHVNSSFCFLLNLEPLITHLANLPLFIYLFLFAHTLDMHKIQMMKKNIGGVMKPQGLYNMPPLNLRRKTSNNKK